MTTVRRIAAVVLLASVLTGCGQETPPGETVPALASRLERVDAAIASRSYAQAAAALERLMADTAEAEQAGEITTEQADVVIVAAEDLLARLPEKRPAPTPTPTPAPAPTADEGDDEQKDEEKKDEEKDEEKKDDKEDEDDKEGEGGGNGDGSENGPDDGHGN